MRGDDLAGDREAEARSAVVTSPRAIQTGEALEHVRPFVARNAGTVVDDRNLHGAGGFAKLHVYDPRRVALGVVEQVADDTAELVGVAENLTARHACQVHRDAATGLYRSRDFENDVVEVDSIAPKWQLVGVALREH